ARPRGRTAGVRAAARAAERAPAAARCLALLFLGVLEEVLDDVDWRRENDRRRRRATDFDQRLQVAQLQRDRVLLDHDRGVFQLLGRLELALGVDDLRATLALRLGLTRHRLLHPRRDLDVLHLDDR